MEAKKIQQKQNWWGKHKDCKEDKLKHNATDLFKPFNISNADYS